jgi:hypothetical protein
VAEDTDGAREFDVVEVAEEIFRLLVTVIVRGLGQSGVFNLRLSSLKAGRLRQDRQ